MNKRLLRTGASVTALLICLSASTSLMAAPITATWTSGNNDSWDSGVGNPANWSFSAAPATATFPNNVGGDTFSVQIDNGGAGNSVVDLNTSVTIDSLNVSSNDTLNFINSNDLALVNGTLTNNGAINMNSLGGATDLVFSAGGSISGTGTLTLSDSNQNRVFINGAGNILTNGLGHTIQGAGQIGFNSGGIVNSGSIIQQGTTALFIDPDSTGNFVNNNVLRAEGSGGLFLNGADYTNNSTIEAANGSHVTFNDTGVKIVGGNLTTTGTGEFRTNTTSTGAQLDGVTLTSGSKLVQNNSHDLRIFNGITNEGTWELNSAGGATDVRFVGTQTISGSGTLKMTDSDQNRIIADAAADIITNSATHTIRGAGQILAAVGGFVNNGTIIQEGVTNLHINPDNSAGFVNNGTMQATGAGGILLSDGTFTNNTSISVSTGSNLTMNSTNATIVGGDLTTAGTGEIRTNLTTAGALLDNVRLTSGSNLVSGNSHDWRFQNGFVNDGTISMNSAGGSTDLEFIGTQTLSGNGEIVMSDSNQNRIFADDAADTLTIGANQVIRGAGQIGLNLGGTINNGTIRQQGTVNLHLDPGALGFTQNNILRAEGTGGISFGAGTFTNNTTIEALADSNLTITSSLTTIVGGDLTTIGTAEIRTTQTSTGALLDNVRLTAGSNMVSAISQDWRFQNGFVNDGTVSMNSAGGATDLEFVGTQTLGGSGEVVMSDSSQNRIFVDDAADTLTIGANQVIRGAGQIGLNVGGTVNNGEIRQQGTINLHLDPGALGFTQNNILRAEGTGGISFGAGTFTNNTTIEALNGSNLTFLSNQSVLVGGDLTTVGTAEIRTNQTTIGATLDNVRLTAGSKIVSANSHDWRFQNGFVNDGTIEMNSAGGATDLEFVGTQTLSGSGSIIMSDNFQNRIRNDTGADTLTIGANQTISGAGQIGGNTGGMENFGTIDANQTNNAILIDGGALKFVNHGTLRASGAAGFDISAANDEFEQAGGLIDVQSGSRLDVTLGTNFIQTGGQVTINGIMTTAASNSSVQLQGGRFGGSGTVDFNGNGSHALNNTGGTLAVGNSPGILTIMDGDYFQGSAASFEFELFGAVVGVGHDLLNILNGDADLSGSLDVVADQGFASTLNVGDQFEVVRLESGHSFLSGFFDTLTTNLTGLAFNQLFIGDSLWIEVTQADVPAPGVSEPETMLVFLGSLGVLVGLRRRRRAIH